MKNFNAYNNIFKIVIDVNVVTLCITFAKYNSIHIYKKWQNNLN